MEQIQLKAKKRRVIGKKVKRLRREGFIPAILYGHNIDPLSLKIEERALRHALAQAGGTRLIALKVGRERKPRVILAREVQRDAITRDLLHVDFYEVTRGEKIKTEVPLIFMGVPPIVGKEEGILIHGLESVEVECLPGDLIHSIEVDLTGLNEIEQAIHVGDLEVKPTVEILTDAEELVAKVLPPGKEEVEEVEEEVVVEEVPEVEVVPKARKPEEELEEVEEAEKEG